MAEPTAFPDEHVSEPLAYRKISGIAVTSFALGGIFAIYVMFAGLVGLRDRTPLLLSAPAQAVPVFGFSLSLLALLLINKSDGTLGGRWLATWGLWLSIIFGLGYWAYFGATYFAVRQQSDVFVREWFNKLTKGKISSAFVDCQNPGIRARINPEDENTININFKLAFGSQGAERGLPLDVFRENELVRVFVQGMQDTKVVPKGIQDWDFESLSYTVSRVYRITTDEGSWEVLIKSRGMESASREFEGRQWIVVWSESKVLSHELSDFGRRVQELKGVAGQLAGNWISRVAAGDLIGGYKDTRGLSSGPSSEAAANYARLLAAGLGAAPVQANVVAPSPLNCTLSYFHLLAAGEAVRPAIFGLLERDQFLKSDKFKANDEALRKAAFVSMESFLGAAKAGEEFRGVKFDPKSSRRPWRKTQDSLILPVDCRFGMGGRMEDPRYSVESTVFVEFSPFDASQTPSWRIAGIELIEAKDRTKESRMQMEPPPPKPSRPEVGAPPTPIQIPGNK